MTLGTDRAVRYARRNRVPAALLLFGLVLGIAALRAGHAPDRRQVAAYLIASVFIVLAASVVPDLVVVFLAALLLAMAFDEERRLEALLGQFRALLNPSANGTSPNRLGGPVPAGSA